MSVLGRANTISINSHGCPAHKILLSPFCRLSKNQGLEKWSHLLETLVETLFIMSLKPMCFSFCPAAPPVRAAIIYGHLAWTEEGARPTAHRAQGSETDVLSTQPARGRAGLRTRTNKGRRAWALRSEYTLFPGALFAFFIFFFPMLWSHVVTLRWIFELLMKRS